MIVLYFTATLLIGGLLVGTSVAQATIDRQTPLKVHIAPGDPSTSRVSGRITSIAVDIDDPVTVFRNINGRFTPVSTDVGTGPVAIQTGRTVRLRIAATNNRGPLLLKSSVPFSYQVECSGLPVAPATGVSTPSLTVVGVISDTAFNWETEESWKGTCRMMVFALTDRQDYAIKVRFE